MIVEIDESWVSKPKYNAGAGWKTPRRLVFGMVEEQQGLLWMEEIPDQTMTTLLPIFADHALPGTMIYSDQLGAYRHIPDLHDNVTFQPLNLKHASVCHKRNFRDPLSGACTNHIECMWKELKMKFKGMHGTSGVRLNSYIWEFMWRWNYARHRPSVFQAILECIREQYPLNRPR